MVEFGESVKLINQILSTGLMLTFCSLLTVKSKEGNISIKPIVFDLSPLRLSFIVCVCVYIYIYIYKTLV